VGKKLSRFKDVLVTSNLHNILKELVIIEGSHDCLTMLSQFKSGYYTKFRINVS
jgi:hypothetical protein